MITPLDIQKKEFKKAIRGYDPKDVDSFLDELLIDYENIYKENIELKDKVNLLADQIRQYKTLEETLKDTLIVAQSTADEVTSSARKKAENIIEEAEIKGQSLIEKARKEVENLQREYEHLKKEIFIFKTRYQSFIEAHLLSLNEFYEQIIDTEGDVEREEDNQIEESEKIELMKDESEDLENLGA